MPKVGLSQPKIHDGHIRRLSQLARQFNMSMTQLINLILDIALERLFEKFRLL